MEFQNKVAFTPEQREYCEFLCAHHENFTTNRITSQMFWKFPELKGRSALEIYGLISSLKEQQKKGA